MCWKKRMAGIAFILSIGMLMFVWQWKKEGKLTGQMQTSAAGRNTGTITEGKTDADVKKEVEAALKKLSMADSMQAKVSMDMGINIFGLELDALAAMDMFGFCTPVCFRSDMELDLGFWGNTSLQTYVYENEEGYQLARKKRNGWAGRKLEDAELTRYHAQRLMLKYLEQVTQIEAAGTQILESGKAYQYTGVVNREGLQTILLDAGMLDIFATLLENNKILKPLGRLLHNQGTQIEQLMKTAQDIPVTFWIDAQTGYPVRCTMDIAYAMNDALGRLTSDSKGQKSLWSKQEVTKAKLVIVCGKYNQVSEFELPESIQRKKVY